MQKRQQKRDRERLEEARRPFEELNEQYVGFNETMGHVREMNLTFAVENPYSAS